MTMVCKLLLFIYYCYSYIIASEGPGLVNNHVMGKVI